MTDWLSYPKSRDAIGSKNLLKDVLRGRYFNSNLNCLFATLTRPVTRYKTQQTSKHKQSLNVCSQLPTNYSSLSTTYFYAVLNQFLYHKLGIMTFLLKLRQGVTNWQISKRLIIFILSTEMSSPSSTLYGLRLINSHY